jgi:Flp pilus assembly pilin Flp
MTLHDRGHEFMISRPAGTGLHRFGERVSELVTGEEGIAITEYGLLIALIAILLIGVVSVFSSSIASWFSAKSNKITSF